MLSHSPFFAIPLDAPDDQPFLTPTSPFCAAISPFQEAQLDWNVAHPSIASSENNLTDETDFSF